MLRESVGWDIMYVCSIVDYIYLNENSIEPCKAGHIKVRETTYDKHTLCEIFVLCKKNSYKHVYINVNKYVFLLTKLYIITYPFFLIRMY